MRKLNVTSRDVKVFFLGVITIIIIDTLLNWEESKRSFLDGFTGVRTEVKK